MGPASAHIQYDFCTEVDDDVLCDAVSTAVAATASEAAAGSARAESRDTRAPAAGAGPDIQVEGDGEAADLSARPERGPDPRRALIPITALPAPVLDPSARCRLEHGHLGAISRGSHAHAAVQL